MSVAKAIPDLLDQKRLGIVRAQQPGSRQRAPPDKDCCREFFDVLSYVYQTLYVLKSGQMKGSRKGMFGRIDSTPGLP